MSKLLESKIIDNILTFNQESFKPYLTDIEIVYINEILAIDSDYEETLKEYNSKNKLKSLSIKNKLSEYKIKMNSLIVNLDLDLLSERVEKTKEFNDTLAELLKDVHELKGLDDNIVINEQDNNYSYQYFKDIYVNLTLIVVKLRFMQT